MKLKVFNKSDSAVMLNSKGNDDPNDIIQLGPKAYTIIDRNSENDYIELSKKYNRKLVIRKL